MKIKRLEIVGFKSFVDKVTLDFQHGVTGVIGPNGCGKSNVVDAIRWAMGEQNVRHLRGRSMEDVIFGGSETRKPHGMAQVSIVFDNSAKLCPEIYREYSEIMVTRRLFRSGDSEYLINKTPCRLLDITELFMDTGVGARAYSIIEQGKVGMLVSAKPEERRVLIEEVAGVTKFKSRKKSAMRKMDATRQNLVRLGDIIAEVSRQISSLKRQAQRAERFRDLRAEYKRIELSLTGNRFQRLKRDVATVAEQEREQAEILARLDARLEEGEVQLEEMQLLLSASEAEYSQSQEGIYHLGAEVQRVENELAMAGRQKDQLKQQAADETTELEKLADSLHQLTLEFETISNQGQGADSDLSMLQEAVAAGASDLQQQLDRAERLNRDYEGARSRIMELFAEANRLANRSDEIDRRLILEAERREQIMEGTSALRDQLEQLRQQREELLDQIEEVRLNQTEAMARHDGLVARLSEQKALIQARDDELSELQQTLTRIRSRRESLHELQINLEGYEEGTRLLLKEQKTARILADQLRVPAHLEGALEVALGKRLQAVSAGSVADVVELFEVLEAHRTRGTLVVPTPVRYAPSCPVGVPLLPQVTVASGYEPLAAQLLAGVVIVDSVLDCLQSDLAPGILLVDGRGHCLDWQGLLSAGSVSADDGGLLRRQRQLDELEAREADLETQCRSRQQQLDELRDQLSYAEEEKQLVTSELHRLELDALDLAKDRQNLQNEEASLNKRLELQIFDLAQLDESQDLLRQEKEDLLAGRKDTSEQQQQLEISSQQLLADLEEQRKAIDAKRDELTRQKVELASLQQRQRALFETVERIKRQQKELEERASQLRRRKSSGEQQQRELTERENALRIELDLLLDRRLERQRHNDALRERHELRKEELEEFRDQLRRVRSEAEELRKTVSRLQLRCHELQVDAESVRQNVLERYRVDLSEHQVPEATEDELERQQLQLQRLQQKIDALGEVNLMAIEEYREQEQRYDFLSGQRDDLNQSLDDLQKAINQINRTTRRRFKETFEQVNATFQKVFPRLFRGGRAELLLTDENDLLETGVEIVVQPPGKRLQNVNLLSGGEKALTAVALIFSLFLIKPTPFCILDEVDAPLDDANIDRFAEMVKEMTAQSQFIIITHSKRTMRVIDTMYGVTMQEPGVSKLVSVRMNDGGPQTKTEQQVSA